MTAHAMTLPRIWPANEGPSEMIRNAIQLLDLAEQIGGNVVLDPLLRVAIRERLTRAIDQLENRPA